MEDAKPLNVTVDLRAVSIEEAIQIMIALNDVYKAIGGDTLVGKAVDPSLDQKLKAIKIPREIETKYETDRKTMYRLIEKYGLPENHAVLKSEFERIFPAEEYGNKPIHVYLGLNFLVASLPYLREYDPKWTEEMVKKRKKGKK